MNRKHSVSIMLLNISRTSFSVSILFLKRITTTDACAAVVHRARRVWEDLQAEPQAPWDPGGARAFQALGDFVVSALLGTAAVQYPGCSLKDFRWPRRADDLKA